MIGRTHVALAIAGLVSCTGASAIDIIVSGLFPNKAVVQINGGPLQTLSLGQKTPQGVTLLAVDRESATFEIDGKRQTLGLGRARMGASAPVPETAMFTANTQGHFAADGQINGQSLRFVVDTGATHVALPVAEAKRLSLDYKKGQKVAMNTANGMTPGWLFKLDTVKVGNITVHGVEAVVIEGGGFASPLLGMSFLNRTNMKREGDVMTLTRRY